MNSFVKRFCGLLCGAALLISSAGGSITASALDNGIYIADSTPYYAHPYTGIIEDSGGESSSVLGQSMTESALYPQALIEVDPNGNMYATIRLNLMDNIENPQFMVQEDSYSGFYDISADCMQENLDNNTSDFRFSIPNENCIVRSTFYVVPMGRDVIFYIGFSNLTEGSSDFVTCVEVVAPMEEPTEAPVWTEEPTEEPTTEATTAVTTTVSTVATTTTAITTTTVATTVTIPRQVTRVQAKGIVMFDENGNEIQKLSESKAVSERFDTDDEKGHTGIAVGIAVGVIAVIGAVSVVLYRRKRGNR